MPSLCHSTFSRTSVLLSLSASVVLRVLWCRQASVAANSSPGRYATGSTVVAPKCPPMLPGNGSSCSATSPKRRASRVVRMAPMSNPTATTSMTPMMQATSVSPRAKAFGICT